MIEWTSDYIEAPECGTVQHTEHDNPAVAPMVIALGDVVEALLKGEDTLTMEMEFRKAMFADARKLLGEAK
jgi:hypothetical protein